MPDLTAADVTYTVGRRSMPMGAGARRRHLVRINFGDGVKTYPAGGIPLDNGKLGLPTVVEAVLHNLVEDFYLIEWTRATNRLRLFFSTGGAALPADVQADPILDPGAVPVTGSAATGPFRAGRARELAAGLSPVGFVTMLVEAVGY